MPAPQDPTKTSKFETLKIQGVGTKEAAMRAGVGESWAYSHVGKMRQEGRLATAQHFAAMLQGGPIPYSQLTAKARKAFNDFDYFRRRYLGNISEPWQIEAATRMIQAVESDRREFTVINVPPGGGKTFLLGDFAMWCTIRDRRLRGLVGSATQAKATKILGRMRREFTRTVPLKSPDDLVELGMACHAESTLIADFGIFQPVDKSEPWRSDALIVVQDRFESITEKEHTWTAYGLDVDYLGDRIDLIIWDDATHPKDLNSLEKIEAQRQNFDTVAETRLEPTGALFLVGQRIGANDLYSHCLDKVNLPDDDDEFEAFEALSEDERETVKSRLDRKYAHIVYPAHFDDKCTGRHERGQQPWPAGCLLSPRRLPWRELRNTKHQNLDVYEVWYQQKDTNPQDTLVKKVWVNGGTDPDTGTIHWPVFDKQRKIGDPLPDGIVGPLFSYATVDPSPTRYWGIQWWICAPNAQNQLFLMDTEKKKLRADEVLEWDANAGRFTGLMQDWQTRSAQMGYPIKTWIFEKNGAQRFMLQYEFVRRWCSEHLTNIRPHETTMHKNDPDYGVYTLREFWRTGRVRLPAGDDYSRLQSMKLTDECTKYPHGYQDDQVLAMWFGTSHLAELTVQGASNVRLNRPGVAHVPDARRLVAVR